MKQQTKHTPGPWKLQPQYDPDGAPVNMELVDANGGIICLFSIDEELEDASNLIAAAPDLLEALELVSTWANGQKKISGDFAVVIHQLREAIAKATGGAE